MRSRSCRVAPLVLVLVLGGAIPTAGQDVARYGPAHIVQTAPFYLYADESRGPLEALKPGTAVTVLEIQGDWLLVEYQDPRFGVRQGYVKARFVKSGVAGGTPQPPPAAKPTTPPPGAQPPAAAAPPAAGTPPPAAAQPARSTQATAKAPWRGWNDRAFVAISGAYQTGSSPFSETHTFEQYVERATITTEYPAKDGPGFDIAGGVRLWKGLALGVGVTRVERSTTGSISGTIPHPFQFDTPRPVSGAASIDRSETAIHALVAWVVPVSRRVLVTLSGGPSYFTVNQSLVEKAPFTESYPYDTAALAAPVVAKVSKSVVGFNAGIDLGFYFTRAFGVGAGVRYARGSVDLPIHGATVATDAGGLQAVAGLRLRVPPGAPKKPSPKPPAPTPKR